jgi:hypothetical protein
VKSLEASEPPGLFEETQGFTQVLFFRAASGRTRLCLGLGKNQQKLIAISQDLALLGSLR